jgi:hypothetical protein
MWLSMSTVLKYPGPMLLWAWLIGVLTLMAASRISREESGAVGVR